MRDVVWVKTSGLAWSLKGECPFLRVSLEDEASGRPGRSAFTGGDGAQAVPDAASLEASPARVDCSGRRRGTSLGYHDLLSTLHTRDALCSPCLFSLGPRMPPSIILDPDYEKLAAPDDAMRLDNTRMNSGTS